MSTSRWRPEEKQLTNPTTNCRFHIGSSGREPKNGFSTDTPHTILRAPGFGKIPEFP